MIRFIELTVNSKFKIYIKASGINRAALAARTIITI